MTRTLSIITPVGPDSPFLESTASSVHRAAHELPEGWSIEWVLGLDGLTRNIADWVVDWPDDDYPVAKFVQLRRSFGPATARNVAVEAAAGDLLYMLDADDLLAPTALRDLIVARQQHRHALWYSAGRWSSINHNGSWMADQDAGITGSYGPHQVRRYFHQYQHCPFPPAQIALAPAVFWAMGGYPATEISPDVGLLLALDLHGGGYLTRGQTWCYKRHWPGQTTHDTGALTDEFRRFERQMCKRGLL